MNFPGGPAGKIPSANAGDMDLIPIWELGKSPHAAGQRNPRASTTWAHMLQPLSPHT